MRIVFSATRLNSVSLVRLLTAAIAPDSDVKFSLEEKRAMRTKTE